MATVDAGTINASIRLRLDKIDKDLNSLSSRFTKFASDNKNQAGIVEKNWKSSFNALSVTGIAAFTGIGLAVKKSITTFSSFEQSIANVQSVARGTAEELELIEQAARDAGETTKFSASEAADALYSLASAGLSATEATAALDGVLKLAGATGSDLAFTSATVTAALSQFGLEAEQSTDVANVFAAAIGNSQANMQKLSIALRQVGPVAGALGKSIEDTAGALQALFDAGFQGEQAGTALRNILSSLANESDPVVKKLTALGVAFEDLNPAINDTSDIIGALSDANLEAGQLIDAFGREAGPALLSLLNVGRQGLIDYTEAVTGTQAAAEAYEIQMNTMEGAFAEMRSAIEATAISFVKEFAPAISKGIKVLTEIIRAINSIPGPFKIFLGILAVGIPVIVGVGSALTALAGIFGALLGPVTLVVAGIAAVVSITAALIKESDTAARRQEDLKKTSEELTKKIIDYEQATRELEKALADGNLEEAKTLKLRQDLLKTQIAAALGNDIKAIQALEREEAKQNKTLEKLTKEYNNALSVYNKYERALQDQIRSGNANSETAIFYRTELKDLSVSVADVTKRLNDQKAVLGEVRVAREDELDTLANALALGQLELSQIRTFNKAIAEEVFTRAEKIKAQKESVKELEKENEVTKTAAANKRAEAAATESGAKATEESTAAKIENTEATANNSASYAEITDKTKDYELQLLRLVGTEQEIIQAERDLAIQAALSSISFVDATENQIVAVFRQVEAINELYDTLEDRSKSGLEQWLDDNKQYIDASLGAFNNFIGALDSLFTSSADKQIEEIDRTLQARLEALDSELQKELETKGLLEETETERLQRQIQEAVDSGDTVTANQLKNELERLQITQKYNEDKKAAEDQAAKESAQIEYKAALASWRIKVVGAIADAAAAITGIWARWAWNPPVATGLSLASGLATGVELLALKNAKPEQPAFQTGGIVVPSGAYGRSVTVAENGAPELMLNGGTEGTAMMQEFANQIVRAMGSRGGGSGKISVALDVDGRRLAETSANYYNNGQVRLKL